jgi:hypothetical protein
MVIDAPAPPLVGLKDVTVGCRITVKSVALGTRPPAVITEMGPVMAPTGTLAVICVFESTV